MDLFTKLGFCVSGALPRSRGIVHDSTDGPCAGSWLSILNEALTGSLTAGAPRVAARGCRHLGGRKPARTQPLAAGKIPASAGRTMMPGKCEPPQFEYAYGPHRKQMAWMLF